MSFIALALGSLTCFVCFGFGVLYCCLLLFLLSLSVVCCLLCVVCCLLFDACCLLFVVCCLLCVVCSSLSVVFIRLEQQPQKTAKNKRPQKTLCCVCCVFAHCVLFVVLFDVVPFTNPDH